MGFAGTVRPTWDLLRRLTRRIRQGSPRPSGSPKAATRPTSECVGRADGLREIPFRGAPTEQTCCGSASSRGAGARNDVGSATITLRPAPPVRQGSQAQRRAVAQSAQRTHFSRKCKTPQPLNVVLNWRGRPNPIGEACVACLGARVRAIERVTGSKADGRPTLERVPMAVEATGARRHPAAVAGERKR
jgi:hypothetical protein